MNSLMLLIPLLLMTACAAPITTQSVTHPQTNQLWLHSGDIYRLRHDGVLQLNGKTIPMSGFMILNTNKQQAKLALLTGLGIKLATLDIRQNEYTVLYTSPLAKQIPHFLDQCAFSVQQLFLSIKNKNHTDTSWSVNYEGTLVIKGFSLPKKTVFTDHTTGYTVSLQLNRAKVQ